MNKIKKTNPVFKKGETFRMQKKLSIKKVCFLVSVSFFSLSSSAISGGDPSPYANVFNEDIYDQSELKKYCNRVWKDPQITKWTHPKTLKSENLNRAILQLLFSKKLKLLEDKLFKNFDGQLDDLKRLIEDNKPSAGGKALKFAGDTLATAGGFALLGAPGVGAGAGAARLVIAGTAGASTAGGLMRGIHDFLQPDELVDLEKAKSTIERKKKELIANLHKEPISDLEISYVLRKRFYTPELTKQIESALITTRLDGGLPLNFSIEFLGNCLALPISNKRINPKSTWLYLDDNIVDAYLLTEKQKKAREKLLSYHPDNRKEIQEILMQIACFSNTQESSFRRFYYLHGLPGFGKTTATRAIFDLLGLPYYEMNIRTSGDISQRSLEGGDWQRQLATPGHISHALLAGVASETQENKYVNMRVPIESSQYALPPELKVRVQTTKAKDTYRNSGLIINDFDRLLLDSDTSPQVLAFLLDYLDPEKKSFYSPYFGSQIDTSNLIIFITGNNPIPEEKRFDALRDRCVEIEFKAFEDKVRNQILSSFIETLCPIYQLEISPKLTQHLLSCTDTPSLRSAKKHIEKEMIAMMLQNEKKLSLETENSSSDDEEESFDLADSFSLNWDARSTASPPSFLDSDVYKDAKSLDTLSQLTRDLSSARQEAQLTALTTLLGQYYPWWPNDAGKIKSLWGTSRITWSSNGETPENLGALFNRWKRYETPQQKEAILQFHTDLLKSLTEKLLSFEEKDSDGKLFIYEKIINDSVKLENIKKLANHLDLIGKIVDPWEGETLDKKSNLLLNNYRSWLGKTDDQTWKVDLLLSHFKLPMISTPSASPTSVSIPSVSGDTELPTEATDAQAMDTLH